MYLLGSHVGMSGKDMMLGSVKTALSLGCKYLYAVYRSTSKYKKKENRGIKYSGSKRADEGKRN